MLFQRVSEMNSEDNLYILTRQDTIGGTLLIAANFVSAFAVLIIFLRIALDIFHHKQRTPHLAWRLVHEPMDLYMLSLFTATLIGVIGFLMNIRWAISGEIVMGKFCLAAGFLDEVGGLGIILTELAITQHSIFVVWLRKGVHSLFRAKLALAVIWVYAVVFSTVLFSVHSKSTVKMPYRCWAPSSRILHFCGVDLLCWVTALSVLASYIFLYLCNRGNIAMNEGSSWRFRLVRTRNHVQDEGCTRSLTLLLYPLGFVVCFIPLMISAFFLQSWSPAVVFSLYAFQGLSGLYEVVLFLYMRRGILRVREVQRQSDVGSLPQLPSGSAGCDLASAVQKEQEVPG